ncbi:hypothetical protein EDD15DRAFT_2379538 [Pisolithus albus]|nr:hypothetical protein EDD15DRAFT_2379538 [Pisolithus albus]
MPTRGKKRDDVGTAGGGEKKMKLEDTNYLDKRTRKGKATVDEKVLQREKLDARAEAAFLGLARYDILKNETRIRFGRWNSRPVQAQQVTRLAESFLLSGLDRFHSKHAMPLVVSKRRLVDGSYQRQNDVQPRESLPELQFVEGDEESLYAAGGQHRLRALEQWVAKIEGRKKALEQEMSRIEKQRVTAEEGEALGQEYNNMLLPNLNKMNGLLGYGGQWVVAIFDADLVDNALGLHLSQNETKYTYMETPEEGMIQMLKMALEAKQTWRDIEKAKVSRGQVFKQHELLREQNVFEFVADRLVFGNHFFNSPEFKLNKFYGTMTSSYGGVITHYARMLDKKLKMCFNTVAFSPQLLKGLRSKMKRRGASKKMIEEVQDMYETLESATPIMGAITEGMLDVMDEAFVESFKDKKAVQCLCMPDELPWAAAWNAYAYNLPYAISQYVDQIKETSTFKILDNDVQTALLSCSEKVTFLIEFALGEDLLFHYRQVPFMTRSFFKTLVDRLDPIKNAIFELWGSLGEISLIISTHLCRVSSWFSIFLYMRSAHGMNWEPPSATVEMIRAIMAHPYINMGNREEAVNSILETIFSLYPAYLHLELDMKDAFIPERPTTTRALVAMFETKDKSKATGKKKGKEEEEEEEEEKSSGVDEEDADVDDEEEDQEGDLVMGRQKRLEKRQALVAEEDKRHALLMQECQTAEDIISNGRPILQKTDKTPIDLYKPWSRSSKYHGDPPDDAFRGMDYLTWHTFHWQGVSQSSKARASRVLARLCIAEFSFIQCYRPSLIQRTSSAAALIRQKIFQSSAKYHIARTTIVGQQTKLTSHSVKEITFWPDGISCPDEAAGCKFEVFEELSAWKKSIQLLKQKAELKKIVAVVENSPVGWGIRSVNALKDHAERPCLSAPVQEALENLVEVISQNAYLQRNPRFPANDTNHLTNLPQHECLQVQYWANQNSETEVDDTVCRLKFQLLPREEEAGILEREEKARTCMLKDAVEGGEGSHEGDELEVVADEDEDMVVVGKGTEETQEIPTGGAPQREFSNRFPNKPPFTQANILVPATPELSSMLASTQPKSSTNTEKAFGGNPGPLAEDESFHTEQPTKMRPKPRLIYRKPAGNVTGNDETPTGPTSPPPALLSSHKRDRTNSATFSSDGEPGRPRHKSGKAFRKRANIDQNSDSKDSSDDQADDIGGSDIKHLSLEDTEKSVIDVDVNAFSLSG